MSRIRPVALAVITVVCLTAAVSYFLHARNVVRAIASPPAATSTLVAHLSTVLARPHLVFRNAQLGPHYNELGVVSLAEPAGPRAYGAVSCERVYATVGSGVCVSANGGIVQTYSLVALGPQLQKVGTESLAGLPSRARMSRDGTLVATTTFVTGHSYAQTSFSTATVIRRHGQTVGNLETFATTLPDGQPLNTADRNFWGVTFGADDDTFYATAASGGSTWLVRGSLSQQTMTALRTDAECPSLSPDGSHVAYKKRLGSPKPGVWRLAVLDLKTGRETLLAETRSVDDQMEWLDRDHVLYGQPRDGTEATTSDIWVVASDGSGVPSVLVSGADSPAVVRP